MEAAMYKPETPSTAPSKPADDCREQTASKSDKKGCADDEFQSPTTLDGKNDSGPDPEVHDRELPPQ